MCACETWTKQDKERIIAFELKCYRKGSKYHGRKKLQIWEETATNAIMKKMDIKNATLAKLYDTKTGPLWTHQAA